MYFLVIWTDGTLSWEVASIIAREIPIHSRLYAELKGPTSFKGWRCPISGCNKIQDTAKPKQINPVQMREYMQEQTTTKMIQNDYK